MKKMLMVIVAILFFALPCIAADEEITDFTELTTTPAVDDLLIVVDVSDTTDSAEGTTKKVTADIFKRHVVLSAGKPAIFGGDTIATLGTVAISNANPSVLTKDATIDDGLAVGDLVIVNSGTNATVGEYWVVSIVANTSVTLDRQAATGACADGNVTYVNDPIVIETSSGAGEPRIVLPLHNDAITPTLAFGDGDTGLYERANNQISVALGGTESYRFNDGSFDAGATESFSLSRSVATSTFPSVAFLGDLDTGMGRAAADQLSLIAGGVEGIRITEDTTIMVDLEGWLRMPEMAADPGALADHAFLYAKDVTGVGELFAADAAAAATQLTSHNFSMFEPDPTERFPWSFYAENKALGIKVNVDMAAMVRAVEALSGKSFIYYEDIPKSVDLEAAYRAQWIREYIENNTVEAEVIKEDALEIVEVDERVLYDFEVIDNKTGEIKIIKQPKQIGEKVTGYNLINDEVKPNIEIIYETKKVLKSQLKADVRFDTTDGKFYKKIIPTQLMAEEAAVTGFKFTLPPWMMSRLTK